MVHHAWTPLERHFLHIFFSAYGPPGEAGHPLTDLERLFSHVHGPAFKNGPPNADRLRDEYAARDNTGRSKMWRNIIVKDPANYTYNEQLDRAQAHQDMKQAAVALGIDLRPVSAGFLPPDAAALAHPAAAEQDQDPSAAKAPEDSQSSATNTSSPDPEADMRGVNVIVPSRDPVIVNYRKRRAVNAAPSPAPVAPSLRTRQQQAPTPTNQTHPLFIQSAPTQNQVAAQAAVKDNMNSLNRLRAAGAPAARPHVANNPTTFNTSNTINNPNSQTQLLTDLTTNLQSLETRFTALQTSHLGLQNRINYLEQQRESIPGPLFHQIIRAHAPGVHDSIMLRAEVARLREVVEKKDEELLQTRKELEGVKEANEKGSDTEGRGQELGMVMEALEKRGEAVGQLEDLDIAMEALKKGDEAKAKDGDE